MINVIIKTLYKLAALYLTFAVVFLAVLGIELTSFFLHIPSRAVWLTMAVIAVLWTMIETVIDRRDDVD